MSAPKMTSCEAYRVQRRDIIVRSFSQTCEMTEQQLDALDALYANTVERMEAFRDHAFALKRGGAVEVACGEMRVVFT